MWGLCDWILCKRFYVRGVLCERLYVRGGFGVWVFRLLGF